MDDPQLEEGSFRSAEEAVAATHLLRSAVIDLVRRVDPPGRRPCGPVCWPSRRALPGLLHLDPERSPSGPAALRTWSNRSCAETVLDPLLAGRSFSLAAQDADSTLRADQQARRLRGKCARRGPMNTSRGSRASAVHRRGDDRAAAFRNAVGTLGQPCRSRKSRSSPRSSGTTSARSRGFEGRLPLLPIPRGSGARARRHGSSAVTSPARHSRRPLTMPASCTAAPDRGPRPSRICDFRPQAAMAP